VLIKLHPLSKFEGIPCKENIDSFTGLFVFFLLIFSFFFFYPILTLILFLPSFLTQHTIILASFLINSRVLLLNLYVFPLFSLHDFLFKNLSSITQEHMPFYKKNNYKNFKTMMVLRGC